MTDFSRGLGLIAAAIASLVCASAAADTPPTLLGSFKDWSAFQASASGGRTCYALSQPKSSEPKKAKRDPIYFLISDWPSRRVKAEPEAVPGYEYKPDSVVTAKVGSESFDFFTKNEDGAGSAWVKEANDESRLVDSMRRGSEMVVTGVSKRGTTTIDTYSLDGLSAALDKVHSACGM
ncbi:MAG TPA: invasion associated locus B family protein [Rhizomicrobium sp.]|jgi:hypothetical protein|nr:invasion associated locus B family protein [Rhizomicrobium sp.]